MYPIQFAQTFRNCIGSKRLSENNKIVNLMSVVLNKYSAKFYSTKSVANTRLDYCLLLYVALLMLFRDTYNIKILLSSSGLNHPIGLIEIFLIFASSIKYICLAV